MRLCDQVKREQELNEKLTKRLAEDGNGSIVSQVPLVGDCEGGGGESVGIWSWTVVLLRRYYSN